MAKTFKQLMDEARKDVPEWTADQVEKALSNGDSHKLIDVREKDEYREGHLPGAISVPRGFLDMQVEEVVPDKSTQLILYCAGGTRSLLAGRTLREMGYGDVVSMSGGYGGWKGSGHEWVKDFQFTPEQLKRYDRHFLLPEVGEAGQAKLLQSKVLLIGAGGLGSPAAYYLAAAGVGTIGLVDDDVVDMSNLQRQIIHNNDRVGMSKVQSARETINTLNPDINVVGYETRVTSDNIMDIIKDYDVVVDGCDNFPTRYLVNDAAVLSGIPNVYASIFRFEGQVSVFGAPDGPCYRCLYPEPPPPGLVPSCAEGGVLGVLPGTIGTLQATEVVKQLLGIGESLVGRLLLYDALEMRFQMIDVPKNPDCPACGTNPTLNTLIDYDQFCGTGAEAPAAEVPETTVTELKRRLDAGRAPFLLDVREPAETEIATIHAQLIPLGQLESRLEELSGHRHQEIVVHCRTGARSADAVRILQRHGFTGAINLAGGIRAWSEEIDPAVPVY